MDKATRKAHQKAQVKAHVKAIYRHWLKCPRDGWELRKAEGCKHCDQNDNCQMYKEYLLEKGG